MRDGERTGPSEPGLWRDPAIWLLVAVALALRIVYNLALDTGDDFTITFVIDEREYFGAAHMLSEGRGFSFFDTALWVRPPLYVLLLAGLLRLWGDAYSPVLVAQSLLSAATLLPVGWLAWRVAGLGAARWAVCLGALFLPFTLFSGLRLSETLFTLLLALTLVTLLRARETLAGGLRKSAPWLVGAGVLLGLSALTRATALGFLPLVALWLLRAQKPETADSHASTQPVTHQASQERSEVTHRFTMSRRHLLAALILCVACITTLVPWTVRNYAAYGQLVLIDTTGGYNLWLASVGVKDEPRLQADYRAIANQADRQSYAYARAWENITADPAAYLGKGLKESLDLWLPHFDAEERQVKGYALGRVPAWHLLALLLFDDLLYVVILVLAVAGLTLTPPHPLKWLSGLWVLLWVVITFVFFAVTRFRLPIVAALLPWAGVGLHVLLSAKGRVVLLRELPVRAKIASLAAVLAIGLVTLPALPVSDTMLGVERWGQQNGYRQGEALVNAGDVRGALAAYASANQEVADTRYALAAAYLRTNEPGLALALLKADEPPDRFEPALIRGEAARMAGNLSSARSFFQAREVNVAAERALQWAWDHLSPPPAQEIVLGSGLDVGYVRGFYGAETDSDGTAFRWSGPQAEVRGLVSSLGYRVAWSGWRPTGLSPAHATILTIGYVSLPVEERFTFDLNNIPAWMSSDLYIGAPGDGSFKLDVNPFIGSGSDPRLLGVRVARLEVAK